MALELVDAVMALLGRWWHGSYCQLAPTIWPIGRLASRLMTQVGLACHRVQESAPVVPCRRRVAQPERFVPLIRARPSSYLK